MLKISSIQSYFLKITPVPLSSSRHNNASSANILYIIYTTKFYIDFLRKNYKKSEVCHILLTNLTIQNTEL